MVHSKIARPIHKPGFLLLLISLLFAFGCGSAPIVIVVLTPTATFTPSPTAGPTQTQAPPSATPTPTSFAPRAVIKIFVQSPLSGGQANAGTDILRGAELAVLQLGGPLMENGYKVELVSYDDQNNTETAQKNAREIIADPQVLCGLGHFNSRITIQTSNLYHQAGLALVAPAATAGLLTDRGYLEVNRVIGRIDGQGIAAAQFAKDQGFSNVYIISGSETLKNAEYFRSEAERIGIQVQGMVITSMTESNMRQIINRLMKSKPELVYISNPTEEALPFFQKARTAGYMGPFLGTEALNEPDVLTAADPSLVEGGGLYYTLTSPPIDFYPEAAQFIQDFEAAYDATPRLFAARAYDAAGICLKAIADASKAIDGEIPTRAQVTNAIRTLKDYQGITGTYTFNRQGDPTFAEYYVYKVVSVDEDTWDQNLIVGSYAVTPP
jgi:branched-chain amino acid transport system substrate-binding protein